MATKVKKGDREKTRQISQKYDLTDFSLIRSHLVIAHSSVTSSVFINESLLHSVTIKNQAHGKKKYKFIDCFSEQNEQVRRSENEEVVQLPSVVNF